jgi:hypothetical protein
VADGLRRPDGELPTPIATPNPDGEAPMVIPIPYPDGEVLIAALALNCVPTKLVDPGMPIGAVIPEDRIVGVGAGEYWRGSEEVVDEAWRDRRSLNAELVEGAGFAGGGCVMDLCGGCTTVVGTTEDVAAGLWLGADVLAERTGGSLDRASAADRDGPRRLAATADGLGLNRLNSYLSDDDWISYDDTYMMVIGSPRMNFSSSLSRSDSIIFVGGGCFFSSGW